MSSYLLNKTWSHLRQICQYMYFEKCFVKYKEVESSKVVERVWPWKL